MASYSLQTTGCWLPWAVTIHHHDDPKKLWSRSSYSVAIATCSWAQIYMVALPWQLLIHCYKHDSHAHTTQLPTLPPWVHVSPVITERNVSRWRLSVKISPHKILVCHFSHHTVKLLIYDYSTVHTVSILAGPYPHGTVSTPLLNTFALISARVLETGAEIQRH